MAIGFVGSTSGLADNPFTRLAVAIIVSAVFLTLVLTFTEPYPLPSEIGVAFTWIFTTLWSFDFLVPVETLITCITTILFVDITFSGFKILFWIKKHITQQH